jgi:hypothetical protein
MFVRRLSLLGVLVALLAVPGAALATKTRHEPPSYWITVNLPKENGWQLSISGILGGQIKGQEVSISADGPGQESVGYQVHGHLASDGSIAARFPGIGRAELAFRRTKEESASSSEEGCTNDGHPHAYQGVFSGTIELEGKGTFGKIDRRRAAGSIFESPPETCTVGGPRRGGGGEPSGAELKSTNLFAARRIDGGAFFFSVSNFDLGPKFGDSVDFSASYFEKRHGMTTTVEASAEGDPSQFSVVSTGGEPSEATIEPPAPFSGSASFELETPQTASWAGDLKVKMPLLGTVDLTGPKFEPILCEGTRCSPEVPGAQHIVGGFTGGFFGE